MVDSRGSLVVRVVEARGLVDPEGWLGDLNPSARITVGDQRRVTATGGGINGHAPLWGEEFILPLQRNRAPAIRQDELLVHVFAQGKGDLTAKCGEKGTFIGSGAASLKTVLEGGAGYDEGWVKLSTPTGKVGGEVKVVLRHDSAFADSSSHHRSAGTLATWQRLTVRVALPTERIVEVLPTLPRPYPRSL